MGVSLNERQLGLLQRIAEGDEPTSQDATSVYALPSRGLVTTQSAYAYRTAALTDAGQRLLAGNPPPPPRPRPAKPKAVPKQPDDDGVPASPAALLVHLAEHDGRLVIPNPPERQRAAWRRLLHATRHQQADGDQIVRHRGRNSGDPTIWLETRTSQPTTPVLEPVPIPDRVMRPHPLIAELRTATVGRDGWIDTRHTEGVVHVRIHRDRRARTIRLLHALVTEATRRGDTIATAKSYRCPGGLGITINGHPLEITVHEESKRVAHELTVDEQRRQERNQYTWAPKWDYVPTGRLVLRHGHDSYGGHNLAADRTRWTLDDRLAHVLQRLEELAVEAEERRVENERREAERERQRQLELAAVERRRVHQLRVEHLGDQVDRWRQAQEVREFVAAAADIDDPDTTAWLTWATSYADSIDPLVVGVGPPEIPEPAPGWLV